MAEILLHHPLVFEGAGAEVEQDCQAEAGGRQVVDGLGFVPGVQFGDGFDLQALS